MNADVMVQILFWTVVAGVICGFVYLMHRLTAPAARRMNESFAERYYAWMAAQGRAVTLPRTWLSGGLIGHEWNAGRAFGRLVQTAGLAILAAFALGVWLRWDEITAGQILAEAVIGVAIGGAVLLGARAYERRKVRRALAAAGDLAPRTSFKVVANAHGLFVPVGDRVIEGAWSDWTVTDVEIERGKHGAAVCHSMTLAHRETPGQTIPLIASTFQDGDTLLQVVAARVARRG